MDALVFLIDTLVSLYLFVLLLRLLLQLVRADFRNPLARAIVQLSNPLILPLRRVLPAAGRVDTASVVAVVLVTAAKLLVLYGLSRLPFPTALPFARALAVELLRLVLQTYFYAILLYALMSLSRRVRIHPGSRCSRRSASRYCGRYAVASRRSADWTCRRCGRSSRSRRCCC